MSQPTTPDALYEALLDAVTEYGVAQLRLAQPITADTDYAALVTASTSIHRQVIDLASQLRDLATKGA